MSSVLDELEADSPTPPPLTENEENGMEVEELVKTEKPSNGQDAVPIESVTPRSNGEKENVSDKENASEPASQENEEASQESLEKPELPSAKEKGKRRPSEGTKATATPPTKRPRRSVPAKKKDEEAEKTETPKKNKPKPKTPSRKKKEEEEEEDVLECEYLKGEIIAVRAEEGNFYLAECISNITAEDLERSETFKVQWFDVTEDEDVFQRSYNDVVDHRTIICERPEMKKEIKRKLEKCLGGNPVTSSDEDMADEDMPEVRLSGDKPVKKFNKKSTKKTEKKKGSFARTPLGTPKPYLAKIPMSDSPRAGLTMAAETSPPKPKLKKSETPKRTPKTGKIVNQKKVYASAGETRRGRPPIHETEYIPNSASQDDADEGEIQFGENDPTPIGSFSKTDMEPDYVKFDSAEDPDKNLKPNSSIHLLEHDPAFTASGNPFNLPDEVLAIKPMLQRDFDAFNKMLENAQIQGFRGPDCKKTVLHFALDSNDEEFVKPLLAQLSEIKSELIEKFYNEKSKDEMKGNRGLNRPMVWGVDWSDKEVAAEIASYACSVGCTPEVLEILWSGYPLIKETSMKQLLLERVYVALENGHIGTANFLVETASVTKGCGINFSELQLSSLRQTKDKNHAFNVNMNMAQVRKKEPTNMRITAMHTAASNPNGGFISRMLSSVPDACSNQDERGRKPIHYAATATTGECLKTLFQDKSRFHNIDDGDKDGITPLMLASKLGRLNNSSVIIEKAAKLKLNVNNFVNRGDNNNYSPIHYAAENGHQLQVEMLLSNNADANKHLSIKKQRLTPLMLAARAGHQDVVKALISHGGKIEKRDSLERTALMHAAANGHYPLVALLLNKGADPNLSDVAGNTALHYAAAYGWYHIVQLLLQGSANSDIVNNERLSPLAVALLKRKDDIAKLLFNQGADANVTDDKKQTLLIGLVGHLPDDGVLERINYILQHFTSSMDHQDIHGYTVLHHLATIKTDKTDALLEAAKLFTSHGCDVNIRDFNHRSCLFHAAKAQNIELLQMFIKNSSGKCPDVAAVDEKGENFMHIMVRMWTKPQTVEIIKSLAVASPQQISELCNQKSKSGYTPLLLACKLISADPEIKKATVSEYAAELIETLITTGKSDPSATVAKAKSSKLAHKEEDTTAAHYLAAGKSVQVLRVLLEHKPRLECTDKTGATPLIHALRNSDSANVIALLNAGASVNFVPTSGKDFSFNMAPLLFACKIHGPEKNLMQALKLMFEKISDVNSVPSCPETGLTPLMLACTYSQDTELVRLLLSKNASVNATDKQNRTALHHAVLSTEIRKHVSEIIEILLDAGASTSAEDQDGKTPLHMAFQAGHDPMPMITLLIEKMDDVEIDSGDNNKRTALHLAAETGAICCITTLAKRNANLNARDKDGNSPLALAIKNEHEAATAMLLQLGSNLKVNIVYVPKSDVTENETQFWTNRKPAPVAVIESKPAIQVVIDHKWLNIMTWMLSSILDGGAEAMETDNAEDVTFINIIEAAAVVGDFETFKVLVRQQKNNGDFKKANKSSQNLLHILAIYSFGQCPAQIKAIADLLIEKGVSVDDADKFGITPLHYAAYNKSASLVETIMRTPNSSALLEAFDDGCRTPTLALFWNENLNDSESVRILNEFIGSMGDMSGDILTPLTSMPTNEAYEKVDANGRIEFYQNPPKDSYLQMTPLHRAMFADASLIIDKLLSIEVDINLQSLDCQSKTPVMIAVERNNISAVRRLLECTKHPLLFSCTDDNCRTVLHHLCRQSGSGWGYWENTDILKLLLERNNSPSDQDVDGKTALDYALEGGSGKLAEVIQDVLNVPEGSRKKPKAIGVKLDKTTKSSFKNVDYKTDSASIVDKIMIDESETKKAHPEVDGLSEMADWGQIIEDLTTGLHGDVLLAKVEAKPDGSAVESFTRMQIIGHKLSRQWVLFTRTGDAGEEGERKITPFQVPENAIREFMKQYKIKTGNDWTNLPEFRRCTKTTDLEFDLATDAVSNLAEPVQEMFLELTNIQFLKAVAQKSTLLDSTIMPFGRLNKENLLGALEKLFDAKDIALAMQETLHPVGHNQIDTNRLQWFLEQSMNVTFEFQKLIPQPGALLDRIRIISDLNKIEELIQLTRGLLKLEFANQLLLGAQYRINDGNPIDYIYEALDCVIVPLERKSAETRAILSLIENSGSNSRIHHIFKCERGEDVESIASSNIDSHRLLWLPASLSDIFHTLGKGVVSPQRKTPAKPPTRYRRDKDLPEDEPCHVFYEMFNDINAAQFSNECKYAFLCQVAMGKNQKVGGSIPKSRPSMDHDSFTVEGRDCFAADGKELVTPQGAKLSLGQRVQVDQDPSKYPSNRVVIYESEPQQVAVRYLVRFSDA
ncbi:Oidioi.mRNA.OKI2018_I69.chr1.g2646.t1.cds [Oikopleura dioica]|uniref:Oidioi.mRNA.OKI2018_I69.chr1.g2646.t1.cds n=1 Tax=Oikopleura dioica TaxID=34765 RepID=A0ABN7SY43_OIKDI|nr:Oidioi.mRNA.OKI2018_I69.chr1.g2646.t1.cds [Oikopleura dioica]